MSEYLSLIIPFVLHRRRHLVRHEPKLLHRKVKWKHRELYERLLRLLATRQPLSSSDIFRWAQAGVEAHPNVLWLWASMELIQSPVIHRRWTPSRPRRTQQLFSPCPSTWWRSLWKSLTNPNSCRPWRAWWKVLFKSSKLSIRKMQHEMQPAPVR